ncbi:MAG: hypothetical protein F6K36_29245 [Symploca sp. SIO3C6]|uniref:HTH cro/C1-type domain-containing protein n=1 Tax=Symploca sp. SIO1C4 TaxID=2607765 RepID=A0A6B3NT60_9CYAN|nr:hypothetical protein [Symploca sp. SIO3C6]NER32388.1 hypothetical protein [Symploca sp. SIO1C4]NET09418.1 hypothetical protein [Symploca sp. SIO2B6]
MAKGEESIRVFVSPEIKERFKASCFYRGINMSDVASKLIEEWLAVNPPPEPQKTRKETIAELVQQNYYKLVTQSQIKLENLQAIASGKEPSKTDLKRIAEVLGIEEDQLEKM